MFAFIFQRYITEHVFQGQVRVYVLQKNTDVGVSIVNSVIRMAIMGCTNIYFLNSIAEGNERTPPFSYV